MADANTLGQRARQQSNRIHSIIPLNGTLVALKYQDLVTRMDLHPQLGERFQTDKRGKCELRGYSSPLGIKKTPGHEK